MNWLATTAFSSVEACFLVLWSSLLSNFRIQRGDASMAHSIGMLAGQHSGERKLDSAGTTRFKLAAELK
jgi:hypothetical protein